jgi:hypothetical protein
MEKREVGYNGKSPISQELYHLPSREDAMLLLLSKGEMRQHSQGASREPISQAGCQTRDVVH